MDLTEAGEGVVTFGKHQGKPLREIATVDASYLVWLAGQDIRKQPEAGRAARAFLEAHPDMRTVASAPSRTRLPGPAPQTYREAMKLGWMASKGYGNTKETLLAARDRDGFLMVIDEEDDHVMARLLVVTNRGLMQDAMTFFFSLSSAEVKAVLERYPLVEKDFSLSEVEEREAREAEEELHRLVFTSQDGAHTVILLVWSSEWIDVTMDDREQGSYRFRATTSEEQNDRRWKGSVALLEADHEGTRTSVGAPTIGLTAERARLVEQKMQEVAHLHERQTTSALTNGHRIGGDSPGTIFASLARMRRVMWGFSWMQLATK